MEQNGSPRAGVLNTGKTRAGKTGAGESVTDFGKVKHDPCKRTQERERTGRAAGRAKQKKAVFLKKCTFFVYLLQKRCIFEKQKSPKNIGFSRLFRWSEWRDSNPRPLGPEPSAIPNFATPRICLFIILTRQEKVKYYFTAFGNFILHRVRESHPSPRSGITLRTGSF